MGLNNYDYSVPAWIKAGDMMVVDVPRGHGETISPPIGWTLLRKNASSSVYLKIQDHNGPTYYRFQRASLPGYTDTVSYTSRGIDQQGSEEIAEQAALGSLLVKAANEALASRGGADRVHIITYKESELDVEIDLSRERGL